MWSSGHEKSHLIPDWELYEYDQIRVSLCLLCLGLLSCIEMCIFLGRYFLFTLVISFLSKGFPYKDQIEESFIVMVYLCIPSS